jgi:hypothetical protein
MIHPILACSILAGIGILYLSFWYKLEPKDILSVLILALTAIALVWTTVETNRNSEESRLTDLRPIILRDGIIESWPAFKYSLTQGTTATNFFVTSNVATNVTGYVVADGKKYPLSLGVTKPTGEINQFEGAVGRDSSVTWTLPEKPILGMTHPDKFEASTETEGFYIFYSDVEGYRYRTYENNKLETVSAKAP